ncbi:hypothetical protein J4Q44_G00314510 [Coregonus suidteri]|uniref:Uncharacterized protein n=1 Tax=Coregonus suidteri TaxID=861788 RepID=A0AAN8L178_9TELE
MKLVSNVKLVPILKNGDHSEEQPCPNNQAGNLPVGSKLTLDHRTENRTCTCVEHVMAPLQVEPRVASGCMDRTLAEK